MTAQCSMLEHVFHVRDEEDRSLVGQPCVGRVSFPIYPEKLGEQVATFLRKGWGSMATSS